MTEYSVVFTTVSSEEEARKLAKSLVELRLAACVTIVADVNSVYNWKDHTHTDREFLLIIKTRSALTAELQKHFERNHPYELPEFIVLGIQEGSEAYLRWMGDWLSGMSKSPG